MTREGRTGKRDSVRRIIQPTVDDVSRIYRALRRIRRVEEEVARVYPTDMVKSPVHLSIGQESVAVGVCDALRADDMTTMSYRGHATYLAKGGDLPAMIAELYGKVTGCGRGKAGSVVSASRSWCTSSTRSCSRPRVPGWKAASCRNP